VVCCEVFSEVKLENIIINSRHDIQPFIKLTLGLFDMNLQNPMMQNISASSFILSPDLNGSITWRSVENVFYITIHKRTMNLS
jgi:hypothetical protein